jgi:hypothetical protein
MGRTQGEVLFVVIGEAGDVGQDETNISDFSDWYDCSIRLYYQA